MPNPPTTRRSAALIEAIVAAARARGLTAADLAARAGLSPVVLSRARRTGRYNSDTLERLLAAADVDLLAKPRPRPAATTLSLVAGKLNAGRALRLPAAELRRFLVGFRRSQRAAEAFSHLVGLLEETPIELLHDLVREGDATLPALRRIADYVGAEGPAADWAHADA